MKSVLFVDPLAFCTTLAELRDSSLRSRPVAIAPLGADRALLLALSAEARLAGLERGTPVALARRICPDLIVLPPEPRRWAEAHRALHEIIARVAPVIEPRSWGHSYLDVTGTEQLFGPPVDIARMLEREINERLGFRVAIGIAANKMVSEGAATVVKRESGADIWAVAAGHEAHFLAPEAVSLLPELPDAVRERLYDYHLDLIGEVAGIGEQSLQAAFGSTGRTMHRHALGIDHRPVLPPAVKAECRVAHTFATDSNDRVALKQLLRTMTERLGLRLRQRRLMAMKLVLRLRYSDDRTAQHAAMITAGALDSDLWRSACKALGKALTRRVAVRSIALIATDLHDGGDVQLELWESTATRSGEVALQRAVDDVRRVMADDGNRKLEVGGWKLERPLSS